jgi:hypothetical protein
MKRFKLGFLLIAFVLSFAVTKTAFPQNSGSGNISLGNSNMGIVELHNSTAWNNVVISDRPVTSKTQTGSPFINNEWQLANIIVIENKAPIPNVQARIDVQANLIEINHEGVVKVLQADRTQSLNFIGSDEVFVSNESLGIKEPIGFFKVLYSKKSGLLCHYSTIIIKGAYNPVLDAGIKEDRLVIDKNYYILQNGNVMKLEKQPKKLGKQFNDKPEITRYIKDQHIMPKVESDLLRLVEFIDFMP